MARKLTIKDVARRAKVSVGTASNVITGAVRVSPDRYKRVLSVIRQLGYQPNHVARSLKMRRTKMLGMLVSDITNPFFSQMVRGAEDAALERNYLLLTFNTDDRVERERHALAVLRTRRVDGILLVVAPSTEPPAHIEGALAAGMPIVCLDRLPPGIRVDSVAVDNVEGTRHCIEHLISLGHRKIGIITGSLTLQTARERLQGYMEAMANARIPMETTLVREGDFRSEGGLRHGRELLLQSDRPTALFVSNSMMALGALKALDELGMHCPRDIALATYDDIPLNEAFHPHLTAVSQPAYQIGFKGAELLIQRIEEKDHPQAPVEIRLRTELRIRESTTGFKMAASPE